MAKFHLLTNPALPYIDQSWLITDSYFTIDTATRPLVDTWYEKNSENIIYAMVGEELHGLFNIVPLTEECGRRFEDNDIKEEELISDYILTPEAMKYAQSIYVAALAIKYRHSVTGSQCVAALIAGLCNRLRSLYDPAYLKKMYVNPTTFDGNRLIRKLGMEPVRNMKRSLRAGNDIYAMEFTPKTYPLLKDMERRYARFVTGTSWSGAPLSEQE